MSEIYARSKNITITLENGIDMKILMPSSVELHSILMVVRLMHRSLLTAKIYPADYVEATRITMGRKANLYETIVQLLEQSPDININMSKG